METYQTIPVTQIFFLFLNIAFIYLSLPCFPRYFTLTVCVMSEWSPKIRFPHVSTKWYQFTLVQHKTAWNSKPQPDVLFHLGMWLDDNSYIRWLNGMTSHQCDTVQPSIKFTKEERSSVTEEILHLVIFLLGVWKLITWRKRVLSDKRLQAPSPWLTATCWLSQEHKWPKFLRSTPLGAI